MLLTPNQSCEQSIKDVSWLLIPISNQHVHNNIFDWEKVYFKQIKNQHKGWFWKKASHAGIKFPQLTSVTIIYHNNMIIAKNTVSTYMSVTTVSKRITFFVIQLYHFLMWFMNHYLAMKRNRNQHPYFLLYQQT